MNKADQQAFVHELCGNVRDHICKLIRAGKIPEHWDGIELRQLLADHFEREVTWTMRDKRTKRRKDYDNEVLINNL